MEKILVIDDERPIRSTLKEILEFEKFKVDDAEDGKAGFDLIQKNKYDLILCDIKMPKLDGMEVLEKSISLGIDTPFIMISGHGNVETAVEAIKKGAYDFIQKPLDLNRILVTLRNALDRESIAQENITLKRKVSKGIKYASAALTNMSPILM
jgi:DNA-binding NtrC family response regulator